MPCGPMIDTGITDSALNYNEFIVYDTAQVCMKYMLKLVSFVGLLDCWLHSLCWRRQAAIIVFIQNNNCFYTVSVLLVAKLLWYMPALLFF